MHVCKTEQFPTYQFILSISHTHTNTRSIYKLIYNYCTSATLLHMSQKQKLLLIFATVSVGLLIWSVNRLERNVYAALWAAQLVIIYFWLHMHTNTVKVSFRFFLLIFPYLFFAIQNLNIVIFSKLSSYMAIMPCGNWASWNWHNSTSGVSLRTVR